MKLPHLSFESNLSDLPGICLSFVQSSPNKFLRVIDLYELITGGTMLYTNKYHHKGFKMSITYSYVTVYVDESRNLNLVFI